MRLFKHLAYATVFGGIALSGCGKKPSAVRGSLAPALQPNRAGVPASVSEAPDIKKPSDSRAVGDTQEPSVAAVPSSSSSNKVSPAPVTIENAPFYHLTNINFMPPSDISSYKTLRVTLTCGQDSYGAYFDSSVSGIQTTQLYTETLRSCEPATLTVSATRVAQGIKTYHSSIDTKTLWVPSKSDPENHGDLTIDLSAYMISENLQ